MGLALVVILVLGASLLPFLGGLGLTRALVRKHGHRGAMWAALVGLAIALGFVLVAAPTGWLRGGSGCFDDDLCPPSPRAISGFIIGGSLGLWLLGVGVAAAVSLGLAAR